jgi:hypothetical protein
VRRSALLLPLLAAACSKGTPAIEEQPAAEEPIAAEAPAAPIERPAAAPAAAASEKPWPAAKPAGDEGGDRIYSKARFVWIRPRPDEKAEWIGYLSLGESVRLKGGDAKTAAAGAGSGDVCERWYAVEPRGYVCAGKTASLDANDSDVKELGKGTAKWEPYPYEYGESLGTTIYLDIPPRKRQYFRETAFNEHMESVARARAAKSPEEVAKVAPELVGVDLAFTGKEAPPRLLHLGSQAWPTAAAGKYGFPEIIGGSTLAYHTSFDADERTWVMTWDRGIIPKDRVKDFPKRTFHGVPLGDGVALPLAFFKSEQPKLRRAGASVEPTGASWSRYAHVQLTGEEVELGGERYLVTKEDGLLCAAMNVSAPRLRADRPDRLPPNGTWLDISILEGWLVAYENDKPVYATMISPGRGGLPKEGKTLLETASTPVGDFTISGKFHTATMTSNFSDKVVHAEVPYTQNFSGPYALHAAYWHDDWGVGKSGGCVNLSPIDAMRIFSWTEPRLPGGWHGMRAAEGDTPAYASATVVSIHR